MASPGLEPEPYEDDSKVIVVPINRGFSDGTQDCWPQDPKFRMVDDTIYRQKLAAKWVEENGAYEQGIYLLSLFAFI